MFETTHRFDYMYIYIFYVISENGNVYSFGDGANGQLGHGTHFLQISTPRKLNINFKVKYASCGESHSSLISGKILIVYVNIAF